jgi:acetylornithine deacetylase/succinyl-diaminopimelate desuccinylase-like protein
MRFGKAAATIGAAFAVAGAGAGGAAAQAPDLEGPDGEATALLRELIRANTSNPPGNEALVDEILRARLEPLGFQVEIVPTPQPGKTHLIARLRAASPTTKPLLLAAHADTVGVERELWTTDPFAGALRDGDVLGRGAMDFKGGLAAFTVAAMRLARSKVALDRDVILLSEADEEGGDYGTGWLAENHWSKIDAGLSLNEGGWVFEDGRGVPRLMGITTVDKNSLSVTLRTRGTSTHSSRPLPDSALARLTRALTRVERYNTTPPKLDPTARRYLRTWIRAFGGRTAQDLRALLRAATPAARRAAAARVARGDYGELFNGLIRTIYVPTIVEGGFRANVLPGSAEATVNIRLLPGALPQPAIRELRRAIGDPEVKVRPITQTGESVAELLERFATRARLAPSRTNTELFDALVREGRAEWSTVRTTPALFEAGTDASPWRTRGIPVYGIYPYPISHDELKAMHGNDERISARRLEEGTDMVARVLRRVTAR